MFKKLLLSGAVGVMLVGCGATGEATEDSSIEPENGEGEVVQEEKEASSYFVEDIHTIFEVTPEPLPQLTEEEKALAQEITQKVGEASSVEPGEEPKFLSDRGFIETFADEYPNHTVDELLDLHYDGGTINIHGGINSQSYISSSEHFDIQDNILKVNLKDHFTRDFIITNAQSNYDDSPTAVTFSGTLELGGEEVNYKIQVELSNDLTQAEVLHLEVDNEQAI